MFNLYWDETKHKTCVISVVENVILSYYKIKLSEFYNIISK